MAKKQTDKIINELPLSSRAKRVADEFIREFEDITGTVVYWEDAELILNFVKWLDSKGYLRSK